MDDGPSAPRRPAPRRRLFTVAEANALLPTLVPILLELQTLKASLDDARHALARLTPAVRGNGHGTDAVALENRIRRLATELAAAIRRVTEQGVEVKDLDLGLIDFPSRRDGRVVYLCWRLGEGPIAFWHDLDTGFAGREPL